MLVGKVTVEDIEAAQPKRNNSRKLCAAGCGDRLGDRGCIGT
jgi:hypothetical protein